MMSIYYEKPLILNEIPATGDVVIEASAGTGKTFTLQHLVIDLLLSDRDCQLENILIVTFTRRATAELSQKVRQTLVSILRAFDNPQELKSDTSPKCKTALGPDDAPENYWRIGPDEALRLREMLLSFERAQIFTIHAFCQKLLTENAFHNQQLFNLEKVDEEELFKDCCQDVLREKFATEGELREWMDAWMHPFVSGDPTKIVTTLWDVYRSGGNLERPSAEKARTPCASGREIIEAADATTVKSHREAYAPAWQTDILKQFQEHVVAELRRRKAQDGLYSFDDMLKLVAESLKRAVEGDAPSVEFMRAVRAQYKYALIDEFQDTDQTQWSIFAMLFGQSLIPPADGARGAQHVSNEDGRRIFLIGDPKQAIYKFRGADVWTYLRAVRSIQDQYGEAGARDHTVRLEHNYRSTPEMIDTYNAIFVDQSSPEASFFTNKLISYPEDTRVAPGKKGKTSITPAIVALQIVNGDSKRVVGDYKLVWRNWMVDEIDSLLNAKHPQSHCEAIREQEARTPGYWETLGDKKDKRLKASDIYVLTNTHAESYEIGKMLHQRGIPFAYYRQGGLFQTMEARDILELLRGIQRPEARAPRRAAFRTPFFAVPSRELPDFDESPHTGDAARMRLMEWQKLARKREFHRFFRKILDDSGILLREVLLGAGERALTNYIHLTEVLSARAVSGGYDLEQLIAWFGRKIDGEEASGDEDDNLQRLETEEDAVQVMTMHKAKGLQAEVVFVYGGFSSNDRGVVTFVDADADDLLDEELTRTTLLSRAENFLRGSTFKTDTEIQSPRFKEQEAWDSERLMYVAITRAKSRLYLCYASETNAKPRKGRHTALVRALDRITASGDTPAGLMFVPLTLPPEDTEDLEIAPRKVEDPALCDKLNRVINDLPAAFVDPNMHTRPGDNKDIDAAIPWGTLSQGARKQVSFSGARNFKGDEETADRIESAALEPDDPEHVEHEEDATDAPDDKPEYFEDPRFDNPRAIAYGGTTFGSFIHDILEHLDDFSSVLAFHSAADWASAEPTRTLLDQLSAAHGIDPRFREYNARILFDTLRTPLRLPRTDARLSLAAIAAEHPPAHEVDFLFPIPEVGQDFMPGRWPQTAPRLHRGWVDGSIDLIFRHQGLVYIADWKTNQHKTFEHTELARYTDTNYGLQAQLYTLATVRMLGIRNEAEYDQKFGGCAYLFVRAIRPDAPSGTGVLWCRPSWQILLDWHHLLAIEPDTRWKRTEKPLRVFRADASTKTTAGASAEGVTP